MAVTLRNIADAVWSTRGDLQASGERQRIRDRANMLRDRGLILSTKCHSQGGTAPRVHPISSERRTSSNQPRLDAALVTPGTRRVGGPHPLDRWRAGR